MRVTTNFMFNHISDSTGVHFNAMSEQMQHSQYRVLQSGDDPIAQARIINLNRSIGELEGHQTSAEIAMTELAGLDSTLQSYSSMFTEINTLFAKSSSGTHNAADLVQMSEQLDGMGDDLAALLNMKNTHGDYVFGGTETDQPPFAKELTTLEIDGENVEVEIWVYQGNDQEKKTQVGSSVSLATTVVGGDLVSSDDGTIFETIAKMQHYLSKGEPVPDHMLDEIETALDTQLDASIEVKSKVGNSYVTAERNSNLYTGMINEYTGLLSSSQDADYIGVMTEIQKQQQIMTALSQSASVLMEMAMLRID